MTEQYVGEYWLLQIVEIRPLHAEITLLVRAIFQQIDITALNPFLTVIVVFAQGTSLYGNGSVGEAVAPVGRATFQWVVGILTQAVSAVLCITQTLDVS